MADANQTPSINVIFDSGRKVKYAKARNSGLGLYV